MLRGFNSKDIIKSIIKQVTYKLFSLYQKIYFYLRRKCGIWYIELNFSTPTPTSLACLARQLREGCGFKPQCQMQPQICAEPSHVKMYMYT